jgi:hypothetical protein
MNWLLATFSLFGRVNKCRPTFGMFIIIIFPHFSLHSFHFSSILQSNGVKIESSAITGEPQPVDYTNEPAAKHISLFDARNVALRGCYCTEGEAMGLVIRTGKYTVKLNG